MSPNYFHNGVAHGATVSAVEIKPNPFKAKAMTQVLRNVAAYAALGVMLYPTLASAQNSAAQDATETKNFAIAAGPLDVALDRFARTAGVNFSYDAALISGITTKGLNGTHSVEDGLNRLLADTGIEAALQPGGGFVLRKAIPRANNGPALTLGVVKVSDSLERETATGPMRGYVAKRSATGTKTDTPIIETPQSISVVGAQQITMQGAQTVNDALKYTAGVTSIVDTTQDSIYLRGSAIRLSSGFYSAIHKSISHCED
ncbi:MAG: hypothetical protein JWM78_385 [Verrucomicrobiaceae bacterium]|nr:hypothetical protein [Verrucomicrobiaceae bacterium]